MILDRDELQFRGHRGLLLVGSRLHPVLSAWQIALRQERPRGETVRLLKQADRGDLPTRRAGQSKVHMLSPRSQPHDDLSANIILEAIETGRLAAIYLSDDLTMVSAPQPLGTSSESTLRDPAELALDRLSSAERVSEMLRQASSSLSGIGSGLGLELTGPELSQLSDKLISLAIPDQADLRVFMDASLAGLAFAIAGWSGLEALQASVAAIRTASKAEHIRSLEQATGGFVKTLDILGGRFFRVVQLLSVRRGDTERIAVFDTHSPLQPRLRERSPSNRESDVFPDGDAQARTLRNAARNGAPFCEICAR